MYKIEDQINSLITQMHSARKRCVEQLKEEDINHELVNFWNYNILDMLDEYKSLLDDLGRVFGSSGRENILGSLLQTSNNVYGGLPHLYYHYRLLHNSLVEMSPPVEWTLEEDDEQSLMLSAGNSLQDKLEEMCDALLEATESSQILQRLFSLPSSTWVKANTLTEELPVFEKRFERINAEIPLTLNITWIDYPQSLQGDGFCLIVFFVEAIPWIKQKVFNRAEFLRED